MLRSAWIVLGKSKDELKDVVRQSTVGELDLFKSLQTSNEFLKACAEVLSVAECAFFLPAPRLWRNERHGGRLT
jgi:hypothetical protein